MFTDNKIRFFYHAVLLEDGIVHASSIRGGLCVHLQIHRRWAVCVAQHLRFDKDFVREADLVLPDVRPASSCTPGRADNYCWLMQCFTTVPPAPVTGVAAVRCNLSSRLASTHVSRLSTAHVCGVRGFVPSSLRGVRARLRSFFGTSRREREDQPGEPRPLARGHRVGPTGQSRG